MALAGRTYQEVCANFAWNIPERFNIAQAICDRHVGESRPAILTEDGALSFEWFQDRSRRLANALAAYGVERGDRVAILLPQCPEALIAHLALYRLGAVALRLLAFALVVAAAALTPGPVEAARRPEPA